MSDSASTELGPALDLPADRDGAPSGTRLWELILAERDALLAARRAPAENSTRAAAHLAILRLLVERAGGDRGTRVGSATPLEVARELADVFRFDGDPSQSRAIGMLLKGLGPLNVEVLRPQGEFNQALVDVLRQLRGAGPSAGGQWIRQRLAGLARPTAWAVKSHRRDVSGRLVELTKSSYLKAVGPFVAPVLEAQRRWNEAVIDFLVERSPAGLARIQQLQDPLAGSEAPALKKASARLWTQVLRRQVRFNAHVVSLLEGGPAGSTRDPPVAEWIARRAQLRIEQLRPLLTGKAGPTVTVVVLSQGGEDSRLRASLESLRAQTHERWTAVVVTPEGGTALPAELTKDPRIGARTVRVRALKGATEWLVFVEAGDRLATHALAELLDDAFPADADLVYSDEDAGASGAFFKAAFSYELLTSCDYASHLLFLRSELFDELGGLSGVDDSALYELVLRASERSASIRHLPEVLVTRAQRQVPEGAHNALVAHLERVGAEATVHDAPSFLEVHYRVEEEPLVSIIVPFKDKPELLNTLVTTLIAITHYSRFELLLVDNESREPATAQLLSTFGDPRIRRLSWNHPFRYPAINNFAAREAKGELLLFLNNDIEVTDPDWLRLLVGHALQPGVGAVGPKLLFPDGTIQHAGVVVGMGGFAGHAFAGQPDDGRWTVAGTADWARNTLALTSAAMLMRRSLFEQLGGFDERFQVCGSDVDLCLRAWERGRRTVYQPASRLVHHESASRRGASIPAGDFWESFRSYAPYFDQDPFYSPHLSLADTTPRLRDEKSPAAIDVALSQLAGQEAIGSDLRLSGGRLSWVRWGQDMVRKLDLSPAQLATARKPTLSRERPRTVTWFLPYFDHAFGGVHTLLRFADTWRQRFAVENRFVVFDYPHVSSREMEAKVAMLFDPLPGRFEVLKTLADLDTLAPSDVSIATLWSSAYYVVRHTGARARAYFVQDDEPHFYPGGAMSGLAEGSYRLGLFGIFNSQGVHDYVTTQYGMRGTFFEPSVDHQLFNATGRSVGQKPVRIFFYGRPSIDRNAFELGLEALRLLKKQLGVQVQCVSAGEAWNPSWFEVEGIVENLGVLPYRDTAALYRSIDVGLCFMFTKHPSYLPLELMASGVTVVTNDNPANAWLFERGKNCLLSEATASAVAAQLWAACTDGGLRERIGRAAALRLEATGWEDQAEKTFEALARHCTQPITAGPRTPPRS